MSRPYAEFAQKPPRHSVATLPGNRIMLAFYDEITQLDANIPDDAKEVPAAERWRAACYVTTIPDRPGILARIEANLDAWHDAVVSEATRTEAWRARCERDDLLAKCDYTMGTDYPATDAERDAWRTYRQALRDIPEQEGFPWDIAWPEPPKREKGEDTILGAIDELIGGGDE